MAQSQATQIASTLFEGYEHLKELVRRDAKNRAVAELLADLTTKALQFLSGCQRVPLVSKVHGKTYFSFTIKRSGKLSRAVNEELFNPNIRRQLSRLADGTLINLALSDRSRLLYTVAMAYCCVPTC